MEQLKDHSRGDEAFLITSSYILELAHRAYTLFKSSQTAQKRELINFVFANFEADGGNLLYKIKEPFGELLFCAKSSKWLPLAHILRTKYFQEIIEMGRDFSHFWKVQNAHRAN